MSTSIKTPQFRVSFPQVFTPKAMNETAKPKYSLSMLFDKGENLSKLKAAAKQAAIEEWGDDIPKHLKSPFKQQGDKEYDGYEDGAIYLTCTSASRPGVVDENVERIVDESEFYAGCFAIATVTAKSYGGKGTTFAPGVTFYLNNVMKVADGDSLSGRTKPEDDFEPIESGGDTGVEDTDDADAMFD